MSTELKIKGKIIKILEKETGTSKAGKDWVKLNFVLDTGEAFNNIICFEMFGTEKVENFEKYNKLNDEVEVSFNVSSNEWNGKYYTSASAWKVFKATATTPDPSLNESDDESGDLPF